MLSDRMNAANLPPFVFSIGARCSVTIRAAAGERDTLLVVFVFYAEPVRQNDSSLLVVIFDTRATR